MSFKIGGLDVLTVPAIPPNDSRAGHYNLLNTSTTTFPKGYRKSEKHAPFLVDTIFEKDVPVTMRDGVKLYCDIFRPAGDRKVPAVIMWSPYGKSGNGKCKSFIQYDVESSFLRLGPHGLDMIEGRFGVPQERLWHCQF